jgi:hypothetical protein
VVGPAPPRQSERLDSLGHLATVGRELARSRPRTAAVRMRRQHPAREPRVGRRANCVDGQRSADADPAGHRRPIPKAWNSPASGRAHPIAQLRRPGDKSRTPAARCHLNVPVDDTPTPEAAPALSDPRTRRPAVGRRRRARVSRRRVHTCVRGGADRLGRLWRPARPQADLVGGIGSSSLDALQAALDSSPALRVAAACDQVIPAPDVIRPPRRGSQVPGRGVGVRRSARR